MRAAPLVLLIAIACGERSKPNTPRDTVRGFGAGLAEFDYEAILPFVSGNEADLQHLEAFLAFGRANLDFRTTFIAS